MNTRPDLGYIDLADLADLLNRKSFDKYELQIIEEVVFLCVNKDFIQDVEKIRQQITAKYPKISLPVSDPRGTEYLLGFLYEHYYEQYKKAVTDLIGKYKLIPRLYWQDQFQFLENKIEDKIEDALSSEEKISKKGARILAIDDVTDDMDVELMDSVIIRNKPFDAYDGYAFWCNPYFTRKSNELNGITLDIKMDYIPHIKIGFPLYASLPDMQKILKDNYKKIQDYRKKHLPLNTKKDVRKSNLSKMIDAYQLYLKGNDYPRIAILLEKKYGPELSLDAVQLLIKRLKLEASKLNSVADKKS